METEKSHSLHCLQAGEPVKVVSGIIQFESVDMRTSGANGLSPEVWRPVNKYILCSRVEEDGGPSSRWEKGFSIHPSFVLFGPSMD